MFRRFRSCTSGRRRPGGPQQIGGRRTDFGGTYNTSAAKFVEEVHNTGDPIKKKGLHYSVGAARRILNSSPQTEFARRHERICTS
jgi:hypothetical protein